MESVDEAERRVLLGAAFARAMEATRRQGARAEAAPRPPTAAVMAGGGAKGAGRAPVALRQPKPSHSRVLDAPLRAGAGAGAGDAAMSRGAAARSPSPTAGAPCVPRLMLPPLAPATDPTPVAEAAAAAAAGAVCARRVCACARI